jgi:sugar phosphate isomerase/epimerase
MKIGVCGGTDKAPMIKRLGFDYIEENMSKILELSDAEFADKVREYEALGLPVYSFNVFFDKEIELYSDEFFSGLEDYGRKAFSRAKALGGSICVVGSGKARSIPEGVTRESAEARFVEILSLLGGIAEDYSIKLAIETLNRSETNFITTVCEAAELARRVGRKNVGSIVDFYHFSMENESDESLLSCGDVIMHAHFAVPKSRKAVPDAEDIPTLAHWAELLREINYSGAISIEARYDDFESELAEGAKHLDPFRNY